MTSDAQKGGTTRLLVGFDPLCGWCYGIIPALREVARARPQLPQDILLAGLVSGDRVGPYAQMEGYIRSASQRLRAVTGRAPSEAFFELIRRPGVVGDSGPPSIVIAHVQREAPEAMPDFAHALTEAHFEAGRDLGDPATYVELFERAGLSLTVPALDDAAAAERAWRAGRQLGVSRFPTLILDSGGRLQPLPSAYDGAALLGAIARAEASEAAL